MQKKALIGMILVFVALIMIVSSLVMPWYRIEGSSGDLGGTASFYQDFYFDRTKVGGTSLIFKISIEVSYDNESLKAENTVKTFRTTQTFVLLGIMGCIIGLIGAAMVMFEKIGSAFGAFLVLLAVILSLIAPFYLMFALPNAFTEDAEDESGGATISDMYGKDFFGSKEWRSADGHTELSWGGSIGWFLAIIAMIICVVALILVVISKPALISRVSRAYEMPDDSFAPSTSTKAYREKDWADTESYQPEVYQTEEVKSPQIFQPLEPPLPPPPPGYPAVQNRSTRFRCPECGKVTIVAVPKRPLQLTCSSCGLKGIVE